MANVDDLAPENRDEPGRSPTLMNQILDLLNAGSQTVRAPIDRLGALINDKEVQTDNGQHNAESFRKNWNIPTNDQVLPAGSTWRDDLNGMFSPENYKSPNKLASAARLGYRAVQGVADFGYETLTTPLTYAPIVGELAPLKAAGKALAGTKVAEKIGETVGAGSKAIGASDEAAAKIASQVAEKTGKYTPYAATGAGLGALNDYEHRNDNDEHIGPLGGAATFAGSPAAASGVIGAANIAGNKMLESWLGQKTVEYGGKMLELARYPELKSAVDKLTQKTAYIAHEIRQGRLKALSGLSDDEAVQVNEAMKSAKAAEQSIADDAYHKAAVDMAGKEAVDKEIAAVKDQYSKAFPQGNDLVNETYRAPSDVDFRREAADNIFNQYGGPQLKGYMWNVSRSKAGDAMTQGGPEFDKVFGHLTSPQVDAALEWSKHNDDIIKRYNESKNLSDVFKNDIPLSVHATPQEMPIGNIALNNSGKVSTTAEGLETLKNNPVVGFKFHTEDVYDKDVFDASKELFAGISGAFKRGVAGGEGKAADKMIAEGVSPREAHDKAYAAYADQAAASFLSQTDRENIAIVRGAQNEIRQLPGVQTLDKLTTIWKRNVLYASLSWVKQQLFDNLGKMYVENGLLNTNGSNWLKGLPSNLSHELDSALAGNASVLTSPKINEYLKYDVLGSSFMTDAKNMTDAEKALRFRPDSKMFNKEQGLVDKLGEWQDNGFGNSALKRFQEFTSGWGESLEANARATTYEAIKKDLIAKNVDRLEGIPPQTMDEIQKQAAEMTNKAFFNYRDVTAIEKELYKRVVPFYTFQSKNLVYQADRMFNPKFAGRTNALNILQNQLGRDPHNDEATGDYIDQANNYLSKGNPRVINNPEEAGYTAFISNPKATRFDALNALTLIPQAIQSADLSDIVGQDNPVLKGLHPIAKGAAELLSGKDLFSKQPLNPAENSYGGMNWLGQKGYRGMLLNQLIDPNFTESRKESDAIYDGDVPYARKAMHVINDLLGTAGVRPNVKTGSPETDSASTMYGNKLKEMFPLLPPVGNSMSRAIIAGYNMTNNPATDMLTQMAYQGLHTDDKNTPADLLTKLLTTFDIVKKDDNAIKNAEKKQQQKERTNAKTIRKSEKARSLYQGDDE